MMRAIPAIFTLCLWLVLCAAIAGAEELEARVDRATIGAGETFELRLVQRGDPSEAPDLAPLERDFAVLDVRQGQRTTIVNGRRDDSAEWRVTLAPRRTGRVEVPSIRAGDHASEPLVVEVVATRDAGDGEVGAAAPILLETEIDDPSPYVQAQAIVTVRLHADDRVVDGTLLPPSVDGALVEAVGEDRRTERVVNGARYQVIERRYAVFPQRSGPLALGPAVFEGRLRAVQRRPARDPFGDFLGRAPFGGGLLDEFFGPPSRSVRVSSEPLALDVRPRPEEVDAPWWLPARDLALVDAWEDAQPVFRVGEPVNRVVAVRASGVSSAQIPELPLPDVEGAKQYAEPPVDDTVELDDELVAVRRQTTALIPTRPGPLTLPAMELAWWDTTADLPRVARLPARTVNVLPGEGGEALGEVASVPSPPVAPEAGPAPPSGAGGAPRIPDPASLVARFPGGWLGLGLGGSLLLAGITVVARPRRGFSFRPEKSHPARFSATAAPLSASRAARSLRQACRSGDPAAAVAALRELGRARWPDAPPLTSDDWAERLDDPTLSRELRTLERVQYSRDGETWNGDALWRAFRSARRWAANRRAPAEPALPELYPAR